VNDAKVEVLFERIKIAVPMQKGVPGIQAERRDQAIDCLANGVTQGSEGAVVPG
jgi:hypothetical protein